MKLLDSFYINEINKYLDIIYDYLSTNLPKQVKILDMIIEGKTANEIAQETNLTPERIRQVAAQFRRQCVSKACTTQESNKIVKIINKMITFDKRYIFIDNKKILLFL